MERALLGEFLGTFMILLFGSGVGLSLNLKKSYANGSGASWVYIAFAWGVAVMIGVFTSQAFGSPYAHLNPALTIGFAANGAFPWERVVPFIIVQLLGGFFGSMLAGIHFWPHFKETGPDEGNHVGLFATGPAVDHPFWNFMSEVIATFIFIFVLQAVPGDALGEFTPLILVFVLVGMACSFGSTTGYAINPARDFGPRLMYTLMPFKNKNKNYNWKYAWIPIVGPIVGAVIGALVFSGLL